MFCVKNYVTKNYSRWVKFQPYCLEKLKNNYKKFLLISEKSQSFCAECLIDSLKDKTLRKKRN